MFIFYDLLFIITAIIYLPVYLLRGRIKTAGFWRRFGVLPAGARFNAPIWVHAVSVGEVMAVEELLRGLRQRYPGRQIIISTITPTGNQVARAQAGAGDIVVYLPFDISFLISRVITRVKPAVFIIVETEIWPNLLVCLKRHKVAVVLVNGRISDKSFKRYLMVKALLKPLLNRINLFCVQSQADARRFARLGAPEERIVLSGNMKFDRGVASLQRVPVAPEKAKDEFGLAAGDRLLLAASTHDTEEEAVVSVYRCLRAGLPYLRLAIAPRHPERSGKVADLAVKYGFEPVFYSANKFSGIDWKLGRTVFILDTVGKLLNLYALADIVFVGGSLVKKGGQNIIEPAGLAKPVIFGPHMFNFRDAAELFLANNACRMIKDKNTLRQAVELFLRQPETAKSIGEAARAVIQVNRGATEKNLAAIAPLCGGVHLDNLR